MTGFPAIPGSPFMLDHLLGLLFVLHLVFMNYVFAAPWVIAWYTIVKGEEGRTRAQWLAAALPPAFTFAINFGVACLLFVQVLFPKPFFTANILLGGKWLSVIAWLLISFYSVYLLQKLLSKPRLSVRISGLVALVIGVGTFAVAHTMVTNYFLTAEPSLWNGGNANAAPAMNNPVFLPRLLHFCMGSFAITGLWMVWMAWWRSVRDAESEVSMLRRQGLQLAATATAFQIVIGIWQLIALPLSQWDQLFSGSFVSIVWIAGVTAGLSLLVVLVIASLLPDQLRWQKLATALIFVTLFGMVAGRDLIRHTSFGDALKLRELPSTAQPGAMLAFVILLVIGGLFVVWSVFEMLKLRKSGPK